MRLGVRGAVGQVVECVILYLIRREISNVSMLGYGSGSSERVGLVFPMRAIVKVEGGNVGVLVEILSCS